MVYTIGLGDTILQEHIPGASFFIMMIVIIKSNPETIKQISFLLNYEVNNNHGIYRTGSTFLADGGATASYYYGPLQPK